MAEKTYYDWLFEETEEEKEIHHRIDEERKRYEATEAYKEHEAKIDELFDKLKEAGNRRREEAEKHKPRRTRLKPMSEEKMAEFRESNRKKKEARIDALAEHLRNLIRKYETLGDAERKVFRKETWTYDPDYGDYKDPVTTQKDMKELLEILVQTTIDFINERGLTDIYSVGFGADDLQSSAEAGKWVCSTDASIHATGMGKEKGSDGKEYSVLQKIGEYM